MSGTADFQDVLDRPGREPAAIRPPASSAGPLELTILMPCLDEARTLPSCIGKARRFLSRLGVAGEVLVADNGSADGSQALAQVLGARVIDVAERGYGSALIAGIRAARGRFVIMGDSDDSYDFGQLDLFLEHLRAGAQLVMGNRFAGGIKAGAMPPLHRYLGNPVLTALGRLLYGSPCQDFHCGLRGFERDAILRLGLSAPGMEFASEMVVKATLRGLRIAEVPTSLSPDGRDRAPHLRSWHDGWRHLRFLLLFSPRGLFLYPGLLLFAAGALAMLRLVVAPITIGSIGFDINALLYASAATVIGWQAVIFWACARIHGVGAGIVPPDPMVERMLEFLTLERALRVSLVVFLLGIGLAVGSVVNWGLQSFGQLQPELAMRLAIPAVTTMLLGAQSAYGAAFMTFLRLEQ